MSDLNKLYQSIILDHNKNPRHYHKLENANRHAEGNNPVCGDRLVIYVRLENDILREISFEGSGCAISKASASLMTENVQGSSRSEVQQLFERLKKMLAGDGNVEGDLNALAGIRDFPVRVKCVTLAWETLLNTLD